MHLPYILEEFDTGNKKLISKEERNKLWDENFEIGSQVNMAVDLEFGKRIPIKTGIIYKLVENNPLIENISFHKVDVIQKQWGEEILIDNTESYCGKILRYFIAGVRSSAHAHNFSKSESLSVLKGSFNFYYWDNKGNKQCQLLTVGMTVRIPKTRIHQLEPLEPMSELFECSTHHDENDVFRYSPSDSIS